ncbi:MAG: hypothetical protein K0R34_4316, partial [Herbinix sp.]|nr:hypothetical protein [Herbinix sp.]
TLFWVDVKNSVVLLLVPLNLKSVLFLIIKLDWLDLFRAFMPLSSKDK